MRVLLLAVLLACGCKHAPEPAPEAEPAGGDEAKPLEGQLVVGLTDVFGQQAVLEAVAVDGYRFEYVAASSDTSHLVKACHADGGPLTPAQTEALVEKLKGRPHVRFVEANRMRQPR